MVATPPYSCPSLSGSLSIQHLYIVPQIIGGPPTAPAYWALAGASEADPSKHITTGQQMMLEPEEDACSQITTMNATMAWMLEHVWCIEAHIEEADFPPPTYISS